MLDDLYAILARFELGTDELPTYVSHATAILEELESLSEISS